ncbi:ABC transporter substrate-binding protein [Sulfurimonas sp.]|nr:ABC transporter substrate-binding protein [Sulfurimonas sp.]
MIKYFFILSCLTFSLAAQLNKVTLVLPWQHQFQFAGYYMAQEKGFYAQAGLEVKIKEHNLKRDYISDISSGKYEFGVGHSSLIFQRHNKYNNLVLLNAIHQSSPFALISLKYKNLEDIAGKKVMMSNVEKTTASIHAMLQSEAITPDKYTIVNNNFSLIDLLSTKVDFMPIYTSNEAYILEEKNIDYFIFHPRDYGYDFYSDILFTSKETLQKNKKNVDNFKHASLMGWQYAYEHIDETIDIILKNYNTQNKTKEALLYEANTLKKLAFRDNISLGDINPAKIQEIITTYRLLGLFENQNTINNNDFIYKSENDLKFIFKEKENPDYLNFLYSIYFKFMLALLLSIIIISIFFKIRTNKILKEQATQLKLSNKIFNTNICSSTTNIDGRIISVSDAFCQCSGYTREELLSNSHNILKDKDTPQSVYKDLWMSVSSGHTWQGKLKNRKKDGSEYWIYIVISPMFDKKRNILAYKSIIHDISLEKVLENFNEKLESQVKEKTKELEKLAKTDKLTGIFNRVKLDDDLALNFDYFQKFGENFSIILIDIDNFKNVNDNYGHQVGDIILQEVTLQIQGHIRSTDVLGRWGGEEFLIICPKSDSDTGYTLAQKLRKSIQEYDFSRVGTLTICAGICDIESTNDVQKMVSFADTALYDAKHSGRNNVLKYGDAL